MGFEPTTYGLRYRCTAIVLLGHSLTIKLPARRSPESNEGRRRRELLRLVKAGYENPRLGQSFGGQGTRVESLLVRRNWSDGRESNPRYLLGKQMYYHCTTIAQLNNEGGGSRCTTIVLIPQGITNNKRYD